MIKVQNIKMQKNIECIMDDTWNRRAIRNAKKCIALSSWKTEEEFDMSGLLTAERFLRLLHEDNISNWNILEIGGGIGRITKHMSNHFKEISMVDVSSEMVILAKKRLADIRNISVYKTNGYDLQFPNDNFDLVYSALVFQHIHKDIFLRNLAEISRVLKCNGILIFQIHEKKKIFHLLYKHWFRNLRNFHFRFWLDPPSEDTWTARSYSREELKKYLTTNGFGEIKFTNLSNKEKDLWIIAKKLSIV